MPSIPSTSLPIASFAPGRQDQNLAFRPGTNQESQNQLRNPGDAEASTPPRFVFRGEVLQQPDNQDRRYRPQFNQDIDPQNRDAISSYQQVSEQLASQGEVDSASGRIVDFFI